ncbi:hypothetical protein LZ32DRAFT_693419 [Colletotrichum eremochloae]|nr:hypothetical protein LZ32DRAFT_693419 [Colletotrichum eremochloae]
MDHIPWHGSHEIRVPYLKGKTWDHDEFDSFGKRQGLENSQNGLGPREIVQVLQQWLFFGLFTKVLGFARISCTPDEFVEEDEFGQRITTTKLPGFLAQFSMYWRNRDNTIAQPCQEIVLILRKVASVAEFYAACGDETMGVMDKPFVRETGGPVLLGVYMAALALKETCSQTFGDAFDSTAGVIGNGVGLAFLGNKMLAEGWCKSSIMLLQRLGDREFLYLAYTYGPWHQPGSDHSRCNSFCDYTRVETETYKPQHVNNDCECQTIKVNQEKMESIVASGGIPVCRLVNIARPESGEPPTLVLQVEPASDQRPFIAISHVWAHGLGNPHENGLPVCSAIQIQRNVARSWHSLSRQGVVQHTQDEYGCVHGFWMDTFCIPVQLSSKHLRKKAIAQMKDVYGGAVAVQVLDQVIQERPSRELLPEDFIALALSPWARRLWTLQEAVLAKRIHFLLGSGVLADFETLITEYVELLIKTRICSTGFNCRLFSQIPRTVLSFRQSLRPYASDDSMFSVRIQAPAGQALLSSKTGIDSARVADVLSQLTMRSTTRRSDETICISTLLGMDVLPLLNLEADSEEDLCEQRMIKLLVNLSVIPASLAFSTGPKMRTPGFRWAPQTLLQSDTGRPSTSVSGWHAKVIGTKGLLFAADALVLSPENSKEKVANADSFVLFETGHISKGPVHIWKPPSEDKQLNKLRLTSLGENSSPPLLVLLFDKPFGDDVQSKVIVGLVREEASKKVLNLETSISSSKGHVSMSLNGDTDTYAFAIGGSQSHGNNDDEAGSTALTMASYEKLTRNPKDVWATEHGDVVVEHLRVMLARRALAPPKNTMYGLPATLVQGKWWTLT